MLITFLSCDDLKVNNNNCNNECELTVFVRQPPYCDNSVYGRSIKTKFYIKIQKLGSGQSDVKEAIWETPPNSAGSHIFEIICGYRYYVEHIVICEYENGKRIQEEYYKAEIFPQTCSDEVYMVR